jgi:phage terminase large subunit GpA-like protein
MDPSCSVREGGHGHWMHWDEGRAGDAHFICARRNGCVIEHQSKRCDGRPRRVARRRAVHRARVVPHLGRVQLQPERGPGAARGRVPRRRRPKAETLKTFVNTVLGETWTERGEAPDWERLYNRREPYAMGTVPLGRALPHRRRGRPEGPFVYEVVGWGDRKESWSIDAGVIPGIRAMRPTGSSWTRS